MTESRALRAAPSPTMALTSWDFSGRRRGGRCRECWRQPWSRCRRRRLGWSGRVAPIPACMPGSGDRLSGRAWRHSLADLQRALNAVLPGDVAVLEIGPAEPDWHPRFSARRRYYRYTVLNQPLRSPLERRYAHLVTQPLDLEAMQAAAEPAGGRARLRQLRPADPG